MTAALASAQRAEQLESLRRKMTVLSGKPSGRAAGGGARSDDLLPDAETRLPVPQLLADVLPDALPRGTVAVLSGARSLPLSMVAAVTAAGGNAAIVGQPDIGLLAAAEMGADLSRLAVVPDPGTDPVEVAAVLMDGMDLVVLGLGGRSVPRPAPGPWWPALTRKAARCWSSTATGRVRRYGLKARVCGYETTVAGHAGFRTDQQGAARGVRGGADDRAGANGVS